MVSWGLREVVSLWTQHCRCGATVSNQSSHEKVRPQVPFSASDLGCRRVSERRSFEVAEKQESCYCCSLNGGGFAWGIGQIKGAAPVRLGYE